MSQVVNTGLAMKNAILIESASAVFNLIDPGTLVMTKNVNMPGQFYVPGDTIVFTITISLPPASPASLNGITFEDTIPAQVLLPAVAPWGVTTTEGTILPVVANLVTVSGINLNPGETCTITITGTIA